MQRLFDGAFVIQRLKSAVENRSKNLKKSTFVAKISAITTTKFGDI